MIGLPPKSTDLAPANGRDDRLVPEFLPGMDVGQMDFDGGNGHGGNGIAQGDAGMGVGGGIQNDDIEVTFGRLDPGDQFTFEIRLAKIHGHVQLGGAGTDRSLDAGQGVAAVNRGFALAEQIQVWPVEKQDFHDGKILSIIGFFVEFIRRMADQAAQ